MRVCMHVSQVGVITYIEIDVGYGSRVKVNMAKTKEVVSSRWFKFIKKVKEKFKVQEKKYGHLFL